MIYDMIIMGLTLCQQAIMEEADLRLAETKKASYEFERDIVKGSVNARTGRVIAEKVQRYLDDKLRARVR